MSLSRRGWPWWLGLLLTAGSFLALYTVLAREDWPGLLAPLRQARLDLLLLALLAALLVELAKATRWLLLLRPPRPPLRPVLGLLLAARLLNLVAPLRAGDAWRLIVATRSPGRSVLPVGGSLLVEKALDGGALLLFGLLVLGQLLADTPTRLTIAVSATLLLIGLLTRHRAWPPWLGRAAVELDYFRGSALLFVAAALTAAGLALGLAANLLVLAALGFTPDPVAATGMLLAGYATALIPAPPGQLGVYELAVSSPLIALGHPPSAALAAALTLHVIVLVNVAVGGLLAIPLRGWNPSAFIVSAGVD